MSRFQSFDEIYSALYVDFDNIYTRLHEQDISLARTFATNPQRWLRWLEGHALRMMYGDGVRRRILKRCCYMNPSRYQEFRQFFIRSAFQVVDCPPLTGQGKTSADIHLVMDCMDALAHVTRFDEIIILSGDADFTPLLLRIQEHARRSLVLSVGFTSPAYAAACSWRIREDWFISQALAETRDEQERDERGDMRQEARNDERRPRHFPDRDNGEADARVERSATVNLSAFKRTRLVDAVKRLVEDSAGAVTLPSVAQVLQREQEATPDWFGAGTLRDLLEALDLSPLAFSPAGQGHVYDPQRYDPPDNGSQNEQFRQRHPELYELALDLHRQNGVPLLTPEQYGQLFSALADEVNLNGFSRNRTVSSLEDDMYDEDGPGATSEQIGAVIDLVAGSGLSLSDEEGEENIDAGALRKAFADSVTSLCRRARPDFSAKEQALLGRWFNPQGAR